MEFFLKSGPVVKDRYRIGFLDDNQDNDFHNQILAGVAEAARELNIDIIRFSYYSSHIAYKFSHQVDMVLDHIEQYDLDGLLFLGWTKAGAMYNHDDFIGRFAAIPLMSIGSIFSDVPHVFFSGFDFIRKMVLHLIEEHGLSRIAYIEHFRPDDRKEGYVTTMQEYGYYDPLLYVGETNLQGLSSEERNRRAVEILLDERKVKVEAIMTLNFAGTDFLIHELETRGIKVPGDIAVTAYEDNKTGSYVIPGITTIYYPWKELGYFSCINLVRLLKDGHLPLSISINPVGRLILRESCGCLPQYIKTAATGRIRPADHGLTDLSPAEINEIVQAMNNLYRNSGIQFKILAEAFVMACKDQCRITFLSELDRQLRYVREDCQIEELISAFKKLLYPYLLNDVERLLWAGDLFLQAQVLLNEKAACLYGNRELESNLLDQNLQIVNQTLLVNFNLQSLVDFLDMGMTLLNINSCHLFISNSIFTGSDVEENLFDNSVLIYRYRNGVKEKTSGVSGNLKQQLSEILAQNHETVSLAHLLHVTDEVMGFALFGAGPLDETLYQQLSTHISTALQGIVLLNRLNSTYKKLVEQAQREGMADIAADILHNIGNILNSINVSVHLMEDSARSSVTDDMIMAGKLLQENMCRLESFICEDAKGKKLMQFYLKVGQSAEKMQSQLQYNLDRLKDKVEKINEAISAQQSYAGIDMKLEVHPIEPILEDALKLSQDTFNKYHIHIEKNYTDCFSAHVHRAKLFFIIFSVIANAREAMHDVPFENRKLVISLYEDTTGKYLRIRDTGTGIPEGLLTRIFDYGFTTKTDRYGFGLYSCASYMADMGGSIRAMNCDEGKGASIVLGFS